MERLLSVFSEAYENDDQRHEEKEILNEISGHAINAKSTDDNCTRRIWRKKEGFCVTRMMHSKQRAQLMGQMQKIIGKVGYYLRELYRF